MQKIEFGRFGERLCREILIQDGYEFLQQNYRSYTGEIDLICIDNSTKELVFFEIKSRSPKQPVTAERAVHRKKQARIISTAHRYCIENKVTLEVRFDLITILKNQQTVFLKHIPSAFTSIFMA